MTNEQRLKYLKERGVRCPYCESKDISAGEMNADGDAICVEVKCNNEECNQEWVDVYSLTDVLEA